MTKMIDLDALHKASVTDDPFPFMVISHFLREEHLENILRDFPKVEDPGSIPLSRLQYGNSFRELIEELEGPELRKEISQKFDVDLEGHPVLLTFRGKARRKDGRIHTDTKSKLMTLLLYLNPEWEATGGRLRILRNSRNLEDYVVEIPPTMGMCLIFKVTDNCWHGHKQYEGVRRAIQLNYLTNEAELNRHRSRHEFSSRLKGFMRHLFRPRSYVD